MYIALEVFVGFSIKPAMAVPMLKAALSCTILLEIGGNMKKW